MTVNDPARFGDGERDADSLISRGARALVTDPRVIASALSAYQARMGISEADLAAWLGLSLSRLHGLALCTKPDRTHAAYERTVAATADYIGCDPERLRLVLDADHPAALD